MPQSNNCLEPQVGPSTYLANLINLSRPLEKGSVGRTHTLCLTCALVRARGPAGAHKRTQSVCQRHTDRQTHAPNVTRQSRAIYLLALIEEHLFLTSGTNQLLSYSLPTESQISLNKCHPSSFLTRDRSHIDIHSYASQEFRLHRLQRIQRGALRTGNKRVPLTSHSK